MFFTKKWKKRVERLEKNSRSDWQKIKGLLLKIECQSGIIEKLSNEIVSLKKITEKHAKPSISDRTLEDEKKEDAALQEIIDEWLNGPKEADDAG